MAKETAVPRDLVFQIAAECLARDENPSVVTIQRELSKRVGISGGTNVVSRMLSEWREMVASRLMPGQRVRAGVPEELTEMADRMSDLVFELALRKAEETYANDHAALEKERQELQGEMAQVRAGAAETLRQMEDLKRELDLTLASLGDERSRAAVVLSKLEAAMQHEGELKAEIATRNERITHLEADKERLQSNHAHQLAEENARYLSALEAERMAWQGERRHLHEQTDRLRQASKERESDLERQLVSQTGFAEQYRQQAMSANQLAGKWQGQAESLQNQIEHLQKQLTEMTEAKVRAETLSEQLGVNLALAEARLPASPPQTDPA